MFESLYPKETRFTELEQIKDFVVSGNSCQIIGVPGSGKSNLLKFLAYNRAIREAHFGETQKQVHFVMVNFSEIQNRSVLDIVKFLLLSLTESLRERKMTAEYKEIDKILRDALSYHDELVLFQGLKRAVDYLAIEKELTVVFLFDRFDAYTASLTPDFFTNLRTLRNRAKYRFSVVFSIHRPLEELIDAEILSDFSEFLLDHNIYVSIYDKPGIDFRLAYLEKITGKKINKDVLADVMKLTGGHVRLVRLCVEAVLAGDGKVQPPEFFLKQKNIRGAVRDIWQSLTPSEQETLEQEAAKEKTTILEDSYLTLVGLVKNYAIQIPLLTAYIKEQMASQKDTDEHIVYQEETREIRKGKSNLSDNLTGAEYRLLVFLLGNSDRIIERDEIVATVWGDNASTAGVTEQAIDQLLFRLRRKIEDEPNSPAHLLTVKGRGVRFLP